MKTIAWIVFFWSLLRGAYFVISPDVYLMFDDITVILYIVYFGLVAWLSFKVANK